MKIHHIKGCYFGPAPEPKKASGFSIGDRVRITSDDAFNGCIGTIKDMDATAVYLTIVTRFSTWNFVPCQLEELTLIESPGEG